MKYKLLIYAHYYTPDVASTGQLLKDLAEGLYEKFEVTVICVVPSYSGVIDSKYKTKKYYQEQLNGVNILRIRVPEFSKNDKKSRIKNILSYFFNAIAITFKIGKQDFILSVSQPPILGGLLGLCGKWILYAKGCKNIRYIYQIQDINPAQIIAVGYSKNTFLLKLMMSLDKFSCKHSDLIITVGRDLVETIQKRFTKDGKINTDLPKIALINNWIDEKKIYPLPANQEKIVAFKKKYGLDEKFVIMYSGNIGLYYDLENLLKVIEKFKIGTTTKEGKTVVFAFVGAGSVLDKLVAYKKEHNLLNVVFIPYQANEELIYSLNAGDVHWCVNAKGIKGVSCPSKFYALAAAGRPILGVLEKGSEIQCLIEKTNCGICCEPGDYASIEKNIRWIIEEAESKELERMGNQGREYLLKYLTKDKSIKKYCAEILQC